MKHILFLLLVFCISFSASRTFNLITDKNCYSWPAVTQCRICGKTVWIWQNYERRSYLTGNNFIFASGIVHKECNGHPEFKVDIKIKE